MTHSPPLRDHILVLDTAGHALSLRIHDITEVRSSWNAHTTIVFLTGETAGKHGPHVSIQEECQTFVTRCRRLLMALEIEDCQGIDACFAPRPVVTAPLVLNGR